MSKRKDREPERFLPRPMGLFTATWQDTVIFQYGTCCETCAHWQPDERREATMARCDKLSTGNWGATCTTGNRFLCFAWEQFEEAGR